MLIDYHLHTVYSHHAVGTIDDYLRRAKELGIQEVCFTEHISRQYLSEELKRQLPYTWMREEELELYLRDVKDAGERTSLNVRVGLETDYFAGFEQELGRFLASLPVDYVLGVVHLLPMYRFRYVMDVEDEPVRFLFTYFDYVRKAVESGLFDSMAHINLGWQAVPWPEGADGQLVEDALSAVVASARKQDMCLEVNTRAFNFEGCGTREAYERFLRLIADYGVPITLGSDAHNPKEVGRNYPEALRTLAYYGIKEAAAFVQRQRHMVPLAAVVVR